MALVLVIDDEPSILELLKYNLLREGHQVKVVSKGGEALGAARETRPDLIILDIMLPEIDGYEVLRALKENKITSQIPVVLLSAKDEVIDKVLGLELGAEDYITKPFSVKEVMTRVKVHLRRKATSPRGEKDTSGEIKLGSLIISPSKYEAVLDGAKLELTLKEFELLHFLAYNPGQVFSRLTLLEKIWGYVNDRETRTVDVHIRYLRQKIETDPAKPEFIETVRGVGYRFRAPIQAPCTSRPSVGV